MKLGKNTPVRVLSSPKATGCFPAGMLAVGTAFGIFALSCLNAAAQVPILVVTNATNPFSAYYGEILLTEGLNEFALTNISSVSSQTLTNYDVVILGETPLTESQVTTLSNWVQAGGNLIAMRPDSQLAGLLGLTNEASMISEGYLLVNTSNGPGAGIVGETMQFHGTADRYTLGTASSLATLYSNAVTATTNPAVTLRSVGSNGGQAAAFTFDLARSIVLTRQGNPDWADQNRDGDGVVRSDDLFYGAMSGDLQPDWIDFNKIAIPQADEQQRLLANMILSMNADKKLLPRFWYFPHGHAAAVVMTGDDHANEGTAGRFDQYLAASPPGGSVEDWETIRGTSYIYPSSGFTNAQATNYNAAGFEISLHLNTGCANYTSNQLYAFFSAQFNAFTNMYPNLPPPTTHRIHCVTWSGYTTVPEVGLLFGIRLDTTYYYFPSSWIANRPGLFTGSGMPMRFATAQGNMIDVYQAPTQMTDESAQRYSYTVDTLLDRALGPEAYYGAFVANIHTDFNPWPQSDGVISSAISRGVPVISARQLLTWLDARNSSSMSAITWNNASGTLTFSVVANASAKGLQGMVPVPAGYRVSGLKTNGVSIGYSLRAVKGMQYAFFPARTGDYEVNYVSDSTAPSVTGVLPSASGVKPTTEVKVSFSEAMDASTINASTITLSNATAGGFVAATVSYNPFTSTAVLKPNGLLNLLHTYTMRVAGGSGGVKDVATNALASDFGSSFTTTNQFAHSIWSDSSSPVAPSANDPGAIEVGVKFRSAVSGYVTGIRFYKGATNTGTHTGNLWTSTGTSLATVTFVNETASGWQYQALTNPVAIGANTTYVASYHAPVGGYAANSGYFTASGVTNSPLWALRNNEDGANGVYKLGASDFPNLTFNAANYWVDVVFERETNQPVVSSVIPASGTDGISLSTTVSVVFSEAMDPSTINASTITLRDAFGAWVPATVSYVASNFMAVLIPSGPLALAETYTATVKGGAGGVTDVAGNSLTNDFVWSFTTAAQLRFSIWDDTASPSLTAENDTDAVELGMKFQSAVNGHIAGIRFYKNAANTGTHVGNLWASNGTLLASRTFTNETVSGWQYQAFLAPVAINSNTTYVASYHAPIGRYSFNTSFFTNSLIHYPLRALADGEEGANGVFVYSTLSAFPTGGGDSANYWVDVVLVTNTAPMVTNLMVEMAEDTSTNLALLAGDAEGFLTFAILASPTNGQLSNFDTNTGEVTYTSDLNYFGSDAFTFTVTDGSLLFTGSVSIAVTAVNDAPVVANPIPNQFGTYGTPFNFTFATNTFSDLDGNTLNTASGMPPGIGFTGSTRTFSGTPTQVGDFVLQVVAHDGGSPELTVTNAFTLSVARSNAPVSLGFLGQVYNGTARPVTATTVPAGLTVNLAYSGSPNAPTNVGSYQVIGTVDEANYTGVVTNILTVSPAGLTVTATDSNKVYGTSLTLDDGAFALTGTLFNGDTLTTVTLVSAGTAAPATVGDYAITPSAAQGVGLTNYAISYSNGTLTVSPAGLTVTATDSNKVYGTSLTLDGGAFVLTGTLFNGDTLTNVTLASAGTAATATVGSHAITPSAAQGVGLTNYAIGYSNGILTVTAQPLSVVANNASQVYGQTNPAFSGTLTGVQNGDNITASYSSSATTNSPAGDYPIVPMLIDPEGKLGNYSATTNNGVLTITKAVLTVTADNKSRAYGQTNPALTASYAGFVNDETLATSGVTGSPELITSATINSPVGSYPITAAIGSLSAANYSFSFIDGTLAVVGGQPVILSLTGAGTTSVVINWTAISNVAYRVQYQTDYNSTNWFDLVPDVTATNSTASAIDNPSDAAQRFYRILIVP